jgi:uncharacterized protein YndB with AHSA1/START domain
MTDEYSVTVRREIAAPAEDLFDAWLEPQSLDSWFRPIGRETRAEIDPRVGGILRFVLLDDESSVVASGSFREIDRPRRLVFTWSSPNIGFRDTLVTVNFAPSSAGTVVEIHQVGLPDEEAQGSHYAGWSHVLRGLARITHDREIGRQTERYQNPQISRGDLDV